MYLRTAAATTRGMAKQTNEDSYCILQAESEFGPMALLVVCDGVGGLAAGNLASNHVVQRFARWFQTGLPTYLTYNSPGGVVDVAGLERVWGELLRKANARIRSYAHERNTRMGSTFSGLFLCQNRAFIGQVGDSRVYRLSDGGAAQALTQDQTLVERELATGVLTPEEAANHPKRSVILQAVGSQAALNPVFSTYDVADGDVFAVCCDGFYHLQDDDELTALLAQLGRTGTDELSRVLRTAVSERAARGERDNITIVCCVNGPEPIDDEGTTVLETDDAATDVLAEEDAASGPVGEPAAAADALGGEQAPNAPGAGLIDGEEPTTLLDAEGMDEDEPTGELVASPATEAPAPTPSHGEADEDEPTGELVASPAAEAPADDAPAHDLEDESPTILLDEETAPVDAPVEDAEGVFAPAVVPADDAPAAVPEAETAPAAVAGAASAPAAAPRSDDAGTGELSAASVEPETSSSPDDAATTVLGADDAATTVLGADDAATTVLEDAPVQTPAPATGEPEPAASASADDAPTTVLGGDA